MSVELSESTNDADMQILLDFVAAGSLQFGLLSAVLLVDGTPALLPEFTEKLLSVDPHLMVEIACSEDCWLTVPQPQGRVPRVIRIDSGPQVAAPAYEHLEGSRSVLDDVHPITPKAFIGNADYFHLLEHKSESHGCLHIDSSLKVFPDICERNYEVADLRLRLQSLAEVVGSERTQNYWSVGKDQREKCRDCEFRYACPNTVASRSDVADLSSAPMNCAYELETGRWGELA